MLIDTLEASLLQNILSGKEMWRAGYRHEKGMLRASYGSKMDF